MLVVERPLTGCRAEYVESIFGDNSLETEHRRAAYNALQRNKQSVALNVKGLEARDVFYRLAESADVVLEGFRPGVVDRLGVGYQKVSEVNSRIVYCSISGYGQDGPYSGMVGHDINYISLAVALGLIGHSEDEKPSIPLTLLADFASGGPCGAVGIMAALLARQTTGRGQYLAIAMTEGVLYILAGVISDYLGNGAVTGRGTTRLNGGAPYYNMYKAKDGKHCTIAAIEPWFWRNLCAALGRKHLADSRAADGQKKQEITEFVEQTFRTKTRDEWFNVLQDNDISEGKVYSIEEALADPQFAHSGMVIEVDTPTIPDGKVKQGGIPIHMSDTLGSVRHAGSVTGQQTAQVLAGLGYATADIKDLVRRAVVQ